MTELSNTGLLLKTTPFVYGSQTGFEFDLSVTKPLPDIIKDTEDLFTTYLSLKLLPKFTYNDCSATNLLRLIKKVCNQSPTHNSCFNAVQTFAFGGDIDAKKSSIPAFKQDKVEISNEERLMFAQNVNSLGISFLDIKNVTILSDRNYTESGDAYIYVKITKVGDAVQVSFNAIDYTELMFSLEGEFDSVGNPITGVWCKDFSNINIINDGKFKVIRVTQLGSPIINWQAAKNGVETIFHIKNGDNTDLYGKVGIESILKAIFSEYQQGEFSVKVDNSALTAKYIYSTPAPESTGKTEDEIKAERRENRTQFERIATTKGRDPKEIAFQEYYAQDGAPLLFKLDVARDSNWFKTKEEWAKSQIMGFHGTNEAFLGMSQYRQGLGSNAEISNLLKINITTIKPKQDFWESVWSYIFNAIGNKIGVDTFKQHTIMFEDKTKGFIEDLMQSTSKVSDLGKISTNGSQDDIIETGGN